MQTVQYFNKNVIVKYYPDEKVLYLTKAPVEDKKQLNFSELENKLKTTLSVISTKTDSSNSKFLQLEKTTEDNIVYEFLQSLLPGGEEEEDARDAAAEGERTEQQQPPPEPVPEPMQQEESVSFADVYETLFESTYRTGQYWETLKRISGKGVQKITEKDILSLRRIYTKKNKSKARDDALKALDKGYRYFVRALNKTDGPASAAQFKMKYKSIGNLTSHDYSGNAEKKEESSSPFSGLFKL